MDYFNKSFTPLDVNGRPINNLTKAQQQKEKEQRAQEQAEGGGGEEGMSVEGRDLEQGGAGGGSARSGAVKGPVTSKGAKVRPGAGLKIEIEADEEEEEEEEEEPSGENAKIPLLPVDKGIFRRKLNPPPQASEEIAGEGGDGAGSAGGGGAGGANAASDSDLEAGNGSNNNSNNNSKKEKERRNLVGRSTSHLSGVTEGSASGGGSAQRLLSLIGLGSRHNSNVDTANANATSANVPLLLKNDDNFLEHRKMLLQRWKDNLKDKSFLNQSTHSSFYESEKDTEVGENYYFMI